MYVKVAKGKNIRKLVKAKKMLMFLLKHQHFL